MKKLSGMIRKLLTTLVFAITLTGSVVTVMASVDSGSQIKANVESVAETAVSDSSGWIVTIALILFLLLILVYLTVCKMRDDNQTTKTES